MHKTPKIYIVIKNKAFFIHFECGKAFKLLMLNHPKEIFLNPKIPVLAV